MRPTERRPAVLVLVLVVVLAGVRPAAAQGPPAFEGGLTFGEARALLVAHNPALRAADARADARTQAARAQALFPNPSVSFMEEYTNLREQGADDQWYVTVVQPVRYPGEHRALGRAAQATGVAAEAERRETAAALYRQLRHRYLDVVTAGRRLAVEEAFAEAVRAATRAANVRYEEGDLGPFRRARLRVARATYEDALAEARRRAHDSRVELAYVLLADADARASVVRALGDFAVQGDLAYRRVQLTQEVAVRRALARRGLLGAARAEADAATARLDAARYARWPDLSVSAGPKRQYVPGGSTWGYTAMLSVGLPLWNGGRTQTRAQASRRRAAEARLAEARRTVELQVHDALERMQTARERIETISQAVLTDTGTLLTEARFVYDEGEIGLFELVDAFEAAHDAERLKLRLMDAYLRALYDLEYALGVGPEDPPVVIDGALDIQTASF